MDQLLSYGIRVAPALLVGALLLGLLPRRELGARICVYIGVFIALRDAMTPVGLWELSEEPVLSVRLSRDVPVLFALTVATMSLIVGMCWLERELARDVRWLAGSPLRALLLGVACAILIALPGLVAARIYDVPAQTAPNPLPALLLFCLVGNAYEELLFRGFLQQYLSARIEQARAAWISGLAFAFGHVPLATGVTTVGLPLLVFTAYEGTICALLYRRTGLLGATVAHGGGIFLLASGLG